MSSKDSTELLSADRPITSKSADLLGRAPFAEALAATIEGWTQGDSLVIGLYGPWGSGKSSVKNMVLESLQRRQEDLRVTHVEFNPWQWAAQEQLDEAFFREIGVALGRVDKTAEGKKRVAKWRAYSAYLHAAGIALSGFRNVIATLLAALGLVGLSSLTQSGWVRVAAVVIGSVALLLAGLLTAGGSFAKSWAAALAASAEQKARGLAEVKVELAGLLQKLKRPLLVVMDDVDRLSVEQVRLLFQLVKANADFPNLVYLLLFHRDVVEKSLSANGPMCGPEFVEKIVQVGFDVPRVDQARLAKVLFPSLDRLLEQEAVSKHFSQQRWGNLYIPGLRPYFESLRDVYRFLSVLAFHIGLFREGGSFEVNPIDLIGMEALRLFEPGVYQALGAAKQPLTQPESRVMGGRDTSEGTRKTIEGLVEQAPEDRRPQVREIIKQLFPSVEWVFGGSHYGASSTDQWFRELRVCHPDVFDRYFQLSIGERDLSQADLDRSLALAGDRASLVAELRLLNERGLLAVALDRLEAYKQKIPLEHASAFVTAMFDIGDELPEEGPGFFEIGPDMHAIRIIHWFLKQENDATVRAEILRRAMEETTGLYLPVEMTSIEGSKPEGEQDRDSFLVSEEDVSELQRICVAKIQTAAGDGRLAKHRKLAYILYRWREWTSAEEVGMWAEKLIETDAGLLDFLGGFVQPVTSYGIGDYVAQTRWRIRLTDLENFVPIGVLESRRSTLGMEGLTDDQRRSVEAFDKAVDRRRQGKSDDGWRTSLDDE